MGKRQKRVAILLIAYIIAYTVKVAKPCLTEQVN